jgi:hypothetical protein
MLSGMTRSWNAKLLATRQVTQDNTGKRTAGIDGVKSVAPNDRENQDVISRSKEIIKDGVSVVTETRISHGH